MFKSNFTAVRHAGATVEANGRSNQELIDAAEKIYIGVCPAPPDTSAVEWKEVPRGADWSAYYDAGSGLPGVGRAALVIGVAVMKPPEEPFVWAQQLTVIEDEAAREDTGTEPNLALE